MTTVWKPWTGEPTLESVVTNYCDGVRSRYELLDELRELRTPALVCPHCGRPIRDVTHALNEVGRLEAANERLRSAIEDALSIAVVEGRPMHMEPWASLEAALGHHKGT